MGGQDARKIRGVIARAAGVAGITRAHERRAAEATTVLMYHKVLPRDEAKSYPLRNLVVTDDVFEEQVKWFAANANCMPLRETLHLGADTSTAKANHRPTVVLTFDDGYVDNAEIAAPILDRHGIRGTFFLATSFIQGEPLWFDRAAVIFSQVPADRVRSIITDRLSHLEPDARPVADGRLDHWMGSLKRIGKPARDAALAAIEEEVTLDELRSWRFRPMSVEQAASMHARGHEIASHTVTHPILPELDHSGQLHELADSKTLIESWINDRVDGICYPNGDFNEETLAAAQTSGYTYGCVTERGRFRPRHDDHFRIRRRMISQGNSTSARDRHDPAILRAEVAGVFETVKRMKP